MRHYEIVFLVHPDQSEQVPAMVDRYKSIVEAGGGQVHRLEDWGRRQLTHSIAKLHKAHYVLMNVECDKAALDEILGAFKFNDAVLRNLVIKRDEAITEPSLLAKPESSRSDDADEPRKEAAKPQTEAVAEDSAPTPAAVEEAVEEVAAEAVEEAVEEVEEAEVAAEEPATDSEEVKAAQ